MSKKAVWACSNAGLDYLDYPKDITILRSVIHFDDKKQLEDYIDIDAETFYKRISDFPEDVPKTAYVSLGKVEEYIENHIKEGYDEILIIAISSKLSGLYEALCNVARNHDDIKITVFDSKTLAYAQSFMALSAHRMFAEGKSLEEVLVELENIRDNDYVCFAVDTLKYLVLNGRLSRSSGMIGNFLKLKPLMILNEEGVVVPVEKIRTTRKAIERMMEDYFEKTDGQKVLTFIPHANNIEEAEHIVSVIKGKYPEREIIVCPLTPVVGAHSGPKSIGLGFIKGY